MTRGTSSGAMVAPTARMCCVRTPAAYVFSKVVVAGEPRSTISANGSSAVEAGVAGGARDDADGEAEAMRLHGGERRRAAGAPAIRHEVARDVADDDEVGWRHVAGR